MSKDQPCKRGQQPVRRMKECRAEHRRRRLDCNRQALAYYIAHVCPSVRCGPPTTRRPLAVHHHEMQGFGLRTDLAIWGFERQTLAYISQPGSHRPLPLPSGVVGLTLMPFAMLACLCRGIGGGVVVAVCRNRRIPPAASRARID